MSKLIILTRPHLAMSYRLVGVEAFGAETYQEAEQLVADWLDEDIQVLLAIDEDFLRNFNSQLRKSLDQSERFFYVAIPSGGYQHMPGGGHYSVSEMIRQAVGVHITFEG